MSVYFQFGNWLTARTLVFSNARSLPTGNINQKFWRRELQRILAVKTKAFLRTLSGSILLDLPNKLFFDDIHQKKICKSIVNILQMRFLRGEKMKVFRVLFGGFKGTSHPPTEIVGR